MHPVPRKKYFGWPLRQLKRFRDSIQSIIDELEALPEVREIDLADNFHGDPTLVHEVKRVIGEKKTGKWKQMQKIYCSPERCPHCPHGWYWYSYRSNKKRGTLTATFLGKPGFSPELIEKLRENLFELEPIAYVIEPPPRHPKKTDSDIG